MGLLGMNSFLTEFSQHQKNQSSVANTQSGVLTVCFAKKSFTDTDMIDITKPLRSRSIEPSIEEQLRNLQDWVTKHPEEVVKETPQEKENAFVLCRLLGHRCYRADAKLDPILNDPRETGSKVTFIYMVESPELPTGLPIITQSRRRLNSNKVIVCLDCGKYAWI